MALFVTFGPHCHLDWLAKGRHQECLAVLERPAAPLGFAMRPRPKQVSGRPTHVCIEIVHVIREPMRLRIANLKFDEIEITSVACDEQGIPYNPHEYERC